MRKSINLQILTILTNLWITSVAAQGVCVFDIDFTLTCKGASAAVSECTNRGYSLAINTARSEQHAREVLYDGTLESKGFPFLFIDNARKQVALNGAFQYSVSWFPNKVYGMNNITFYYNAPKHKVMLFDDMLHNVWDVGYLYPVKWVGYFCERWDDPLIAKYDVIEMISKSENEIKKVAGIS